MFPCNVELDAHRSEEVEPESGFVIEYVAPLSSQISAETVVRTEDKEDPKETEDRVGELGVPPPMTE
jgi:hypothetical protein